jgi:diguanylate cyclase (GGDEF)-like protein
VELSRNALLDGFCQVASATTVEDCLERIQEQAERLFGAVTAEVRLGSDEPARASTAVEMRARGRVVGQLDLQPADASAPIDRDELAAFAAHAAIALDNARLLENHNRRARFDPLTGLLNRGEFLEVLERAVDAASRDPTQAVTVIVFDHDRFKEVNDRRGHEAGDRLLRASAAALTAACRVSDAAFRLGGDEFALVLPDVSGAEAVALAQRAASAIARLEGSNGVSWGMGSLPADATTRDGLVAVADARMYEQKGQPRTAATIQGRDANRRLEVASRLAVRLTDLRVPSSIAAAIVRELHSAFGYYLAVVHRLDHDGVLRVVAGAGPLADSDADFLAWEQPITTGVNGRVARTATASVVSDTRLDNDYVGRDDHVDPCSELCVPILIDGDVWGVLNLEQLAPHAFGENDLLLAEAVVAQCGVALHRCMLIAEMETSFATTLAILSGALEGKDSYTADHAERVAQLAAATATEMQLDAAQLRTLRYSALMHDIGKLGVRAELLQKPAGLTPAEYEEVKQHSEIGAALLRRIPLLSEVAPLVRAVHERWDGAGYPDGLAGRDIPIESRIIAVCDAWHAMTSDRPYRRARSPQEAVNELILCSGSQFDVAVVEAFICAVAQPVERPHRGDGGRGSRSLAQTRFRKCGVDEGFGGSPGGTGDERIVIHPGGDHAALEDDLELPGELDRICGSGLFGEVNEERAHPGPVLNGGLFDLPTERRLGKG